MERIVTVLMGLCLTPVTYTQGSPHRCSVQICQRGKPDLRKLYCETGTLLIRNVTNAKDGHQNARALQNMRRLCMGKNDCPSEQICQSTGTSLQVVYHCVKDPDITCTEQQETVFSSHGIIRNLGYPSTDVTSCAIRINVPKSSYITMVIHDMERGSNELPCDGGLKLKTTQSCEGSRFPKEKICNVDRNSNVLQACGDVDIAAISSIGGLRFYISYSVSPLKVRLTDHYLDELSMQCPLGASQITGGRKELLTSLFPIVTLAETTPNHSTTPALVAVAADGPNYSIDYTERTVFYLALVVAALSLTGLIVVTIVCIRRQRQLKFGGNIDIASLISGRSGSIDTSLRPLPMTSVNYRRHSYPGNHNTRLQEGYSVVADEIPYTNSDETRSPAYAEVEDNLTGSSPGSARFLFGLSGERRLSTPRKSIENVYSELNDRNVYHEIPEDLIRTENVYVPSQIPTMKFSLLTEKKQKLVRPKKTIYNNSSEEAYILCSDSQETRSLQSEKSDSEESLSLTENDTYETFQSVDV